MRFPLTISFFFYLTAIAWSGDASFAEINVDAITQGGVPSGCALNFTVGVQDFVYKQGSPVGITGSLNWRANSTGTILLLKVLGFDLTAQNSPPAQSFAIPHALLILNDVELQPDLPMACDNPNGYCGLLAADKPFTAMRAFVSGDQRAVVKFNRKPDGMDVAVALPQLSTDQNIKFATCVEALLQGALSGK